MRREEDRRAGKKEFQGTHTQKDSLCGLALRGARVFPVAVLVVGGRACGLGASELRWTAVVGGSMCCTKQKKSKQTEANIAQLRRVHLRAFH